MKKIAIVILAAGKSSRMRGPDKLIKRIDGVAQIRRIVMAASETNEKIIVYFVQRFDERFARGRRSNSR